MSSQISLTCAAILAGRAPADTPITVKGWVRTRRDSKAGLSFVHVSDGSCFHPVQVVAPNTLPNYADEVQRLTAGCAVEATGTIVPVAGEGPAVRDAGDERSRSSAGSTIPTPTRSSRSGTRWSILREVAHLRPRTNVIGAVTRVRHTLAQAIHRFFNDNGFVWVNTPIITASDAEGAGELFRVSTLDLANLPRTPDGKIDFEQDFFGKRDAPHRVGPAQRRDLLHGAVEGLHVRADVPRRELEHQPPPGRVLDDRARDRVRRPRRRRRRSPRSC